jgi:hypothetical protein
VTGSTAAPAPDEPLGDVIAEARRVVAAGAATGSAVRLLGGAAFGLHLHGPVPPELVRSYGDIDVAVARRDGRDVPVLLAGLGYVGDERFNALHGERRMLFRDPLHDRKLDVFIGEFSMCHRLDLDARLPAAGETLAVTELLLTKLQVVQLNDKDAMDAIGLLLGHRLETGTTDADVVHLARVAQLCAADWGWHTTISDNLERLARVARDRLSDPALAGRVVTALTRIRVALDDEPKSLRWKVRDRVGRRLEWYEIPEEVG